MNDTELFLNAIADRLDDIRRVLDPEPKSQWLHLGTMYGVEGRNSEGTDIYVPILRVDYCPIMKILLIKKGEDYEVRTATGIRSAVIAAAEQFNLQKQEVNFAHSVITQYAE